MRPKDYIEYYVILQDLNHKINRKAMIAAEIDHQIKRDEDGFAGAWDTVNLLWEAFEEIMHATIGDEIALYPSCGAIFSWKGKKESACLTAWKKRNGLFCE